MLSTLSSDERPTSQTGLVYSATGLAQLREDVTTYGFGCLPDALSPALLEALQAEARERLHLAVSAEQTTDLLYRARITSLGPAAAQMLAGPDARVLLRDVFGEELTLSENVSCLTLYGEGDHLGAHLDQPAAECTVTILVYLSATGATLPPSPDTGLVLHVYGPEKPENAPPRFTIPTQTGAIVLGRGSRIWHERPRLLPGEQVMALTGCFRPAGAAAAQA